MTDLSSDGMLPPEKQSSQRDNLSIDDLLERYLILLDQYQTHRESLHRQLSNGYLAISRANFSNPNRLPYGRDFYDNRMQASIEWYEVIAQSTWFFYSKMLRPVCGSSIKEHHPLFQLQRSIPQISSDISGTNEQNSSQSETKDATDSKTQYSDQKVTDNSRDPLRWFGVLIPQALRDAQCSFTSGVESHVPALASITKEMKGLEIEIRRARKKAKKACSSAKALQDGSQVVQH
ncbi:hypothetical protein ACLMJK_009042 [Lecanora helva]